MPRAVSRITLEIVNVRVERLQDISEEDSILEGIRIGMGAMPYFSVRDAYADLWDSINGKKPGCAWADNPWVWVVEFKVVKK